MSSAADASADQELLSYDFDKEGKSWLLVMAYLVQPGMAWYGLVWSENGYNGINTIMAQTAPHRPCTLHTVFSIFVI